MAKSIIRDKYALMCAMYSINKELGSSMSIDFDDNVATVCGNRYDLDGEVYSVACAPGDKLYINDKLMDIPRATDAEIRSLRDACKYIRRASTVQCEPLYHACCTTQRIYQKFYAELNKHDIGQKYCFSCLNSREPLDKVISGWKIRTPEEKLRGVSPFGDTYCRSSMSSSTTVTFQVGNGVRENWCFCGISLITRVKDLAGDETYDEIVTPDGDPAIALRVHRFGNRHTIIMTMSRVRFDSHIYPLDADGVVTSHIFKTSAEARREYNRLNTY